MRIIQLKTRNVKKISAIEINPDGNVVIIGGNNAQGKSSVLDSIYMVLGGKKALGTKPIRNGEDKATIKCDLGEIVIVRTITDSGTSLKVTNDKGMVYQSPQSVLDALYSHLTFDPLTFVNENPKQQADMLKEIVGLDFSDLDKQRFDLYNERTVKNKMIAQEKIRVNDMDHFIDDIPEKNIDLSKLTDDLMEAESFNRDQDFLSSKANALEVEIKQREFELSNLKIELKDTPKPKPLKDITEIKESISKGEEINGMIKSNALYKLNLESLDEMVDHAKLITDKINKIDEDKGELMSKAKFPVAGLGFDSNGVSYNGIPFNQCSSAEQLRISLSIGMALHPDLNIMLIKDGSLLDDDNLKLISDMADKNDTQVWIERVGKGEECSVIIEDGMIKEK